jgi:CRISPR-associated exonuclease Cas4
MFSEDELLPISGLQHVVYCERQAALIHVEQAWAENVATIEGHILHEKTDEGGSESRVGLRISRSVPLRSLKHGLAGVADVIEFRRAAAGVTLPGVDGTWQAFPVEYKRGKPKLHRADEVQLCAQALCLEEMKDVVVPSGALYYAKTRRRLQVVFDPELRELTKTAAARLREIISQGVLPPARFDERCAGCSLKGICQPESFGRPTAGYVASLFSVQDPEGEGGP